MKLFLLIVSILLILLNHAQAQCPGCMANTSCTSSPAKPTICPDTLPPGTAMQYYQEDLSFYMPAQFTDQGSGLNVDLNELVVTGVVGLPYGLQFQSSSSTNIFYPSSNPPTTEYGCARFCGTPLIPGSYLITVYVTAHVTVSGVLNQTQDDAFEIPITILPNPASNASFSINNPVGCAPLSTSLTANYSSNGNPHYSYSWDFGNGNTSSSETPPVQTYPNPGTYVVSLQTNIDTLDYTLSSVTVVNSDCDDMGFEPDYYIKIFEGTTEIFNNSSSYASNTTPATFNFATIYLYNSTYHIEVWDNDDFLGGGQPGDDECGTVTFNGHTPGGYTLVDGALTVAFTINHAILNFSDTDTIVVYPSPDITYFGAFPNDTVCSNDTITLEVTGGDSWQWYLDGSAISGATDSIYQPLVEGDYNAIVSNTYGCTVNSGIIGTTFLPAPPYPNFFPSGNMLVTSITGYIIQWYLDGNPISGANGQTVDVTQTGYYSLEFTSANGCSNMSSPFYAVAQSIAEYSHEKLSIFPNPVVDELNINPAPANAAWVISDVTGRVVLSGRVEGSILNTSVLESGVYLLRILTAETEYSARFVKE